MSTTPKTPGLWTMPKGEFEKSIQAQETAIQNLGGNPVQVFDRFRTDPAYTNRVMAFALRGGIDGSIHHKLARAILGNNFFGVEEWATLYNTSFTKKQLRSVAEFPWGEDILNGLCPFNPGKLVKDTHFAFLGISKLNGIPLTVVKWNEIHPATGQPQFYFNSNPWHQGQPHTDAATMELRWYLMLKEIIPDSTSKTPENQITTLPAEYEVPITIAEVTKDLLVFRKTGNRPNPSKWAACKEKTVKTERVDAGDVSWVGFFDASGLSVDGGDGVTNGCVGLGASRKYPS